MPKIRGQEILDQGKPRYIWSVMTRVYLTKDDPEILDQGKPRYIWSVMTQVYLTKDDPEILDQGKPRYIWSVMTRVYLTKDDPEILDQGKPRYIWSVMTQVYLTKDDPEILDQGRSGVDMAFGVYNLWLTFLSTSLSQNGWRICWPISLTQTSLFGACVFRDYNFWPTSLRY